MGLARKTTMLNANKSNVGIDVISDTCKYHSEYSVTIFQVKVIRGHDQRRTQEKEEEGPGVRASPFGPKITRILVFCEIPQFGFFAALTLEAFCYLGGPRKHDTELRKDCFFAPY